LIFAKNIAA